MSLEEVKKFMDTLHRKRSNRDDDRIEAFGVLSF
jgi:hypothetical protein